MARGVNKAIIVGNLGRDPEIRHLPSGGTVADFSIATSEQWTDKQSGEKKEQTEWHRCVAFGRLAEIINEYVKKGSQVYVEGQIRTEKWQDKQGVDRYSTKIYVRELQMLGGKGSGGGGRPANEKETAMEDRYSGSSNVDASKVTGHPEDDFDDDVPFSFVLPWVAAAGGAAASIWSAAQMVPLA